MGKKKKKQKHTIESLVDYISNFDYEEDVLVRIKFSENLFAATSDFSHLKSDEYLSGKTLTGHFGWGNSFQWPNPYNGSFDSKNKIISQYNFVEKRKKTKREFILKDIEEIEILWEPLNLDVKSLHEVIVFGKNFIRVGCQAISRADARKIYKELGEWLG